MLCNLARFQNTSESDQYRLIHHEYAGLVGLERNEGAASDYEISNQLTSYLQRQSVLKLAIKKQDQNSERIIPSITVSTRYLKGGDFEVTVAAKNMQDTHQVTLMPYLDKNNSGCVKESTRLILTNEASEQKMILKRRDCGLSFVEILFSELLVEFNDGVIHAKGFQRLPVTRGYLNEKVPAVATEVEVLKESMGTKLSPSGKEIKTITKKIRMSYSANSSDFAHTSAVLFPDEDDVVSSNPVVLADYINGKKIEMEFYYEQDVFIKRNCITSKACFFEREVVGEAYSLKQMTVNGKKTPLISSSLYFLSKDETPVPGFLHLESTHPELYKIK